ncbi:hypothetical protein ACVXG7_05460 [Enterobacter hormaechei]
MMQTWQALASMTQDQAKALVINADEMFCKAGWICNRCGSTTAAIRTC